MSICYKNSEGYSDPTAYEALNQVQAETKQRFRPLVYICSPFSGEVEKNIQNARKFSRYAVEKGRIPVTPHLLYPQFLNDDDPNDRELGLLFGNVLMDKCKEIWVFGERISPGMKGEIARAKKKRYAVRYFTVDCEEVKV